jgi:hypothetical protein
MPIREQLRRMVPLLACVACGGGGGAPDADVSADAGPETGPIARYDVPEIGPPDWGVAPFPSDFHLGADGRVELAALPSTRPIWDSAARDALVERRGVCAVCPVYFPVDAAIDPASLQAGAAVMYDVATGAGVPIEVEWQASDMTIAVRPRRGVVLAPRQRYVVALTGAVRAPDGAALRASPTFAAARDGLAATPAELRIALVIEPGLAALANAGVARETVATAAVVTVDDTPAHLIAIRDLVAAHYGTNGPPAATVDIVFRASDGTLDTLMGIPAETRPGFDVLPAAGELGLVAMVHTTTAMVITGRFRSPRIVEGSGTELGRLRRDAGGAIQAGPVDEEVRYVLAIPAGVDVTDLPVVVVHGGGGSSLDQALYMADTAGRAGAAMLALEPFQHGSRAVTGSDVRHGLRDVGTFLGPDGFYENDSQAVGLRFLAIPGAPGGITGDPGVTLAVSSQMISDLLALIYLANTGDLSAIAAADPSLTALAFDSDRIFFFGISMGTLIGLPALVARDDIAAAVLSGAIGGFIDLMTEAPTSRDRFLEFIGGPLYGLPDVTWEPERRLGSHPLLGLWLWVTCPTTPAALAPHFYADPLGSAPRPDLLVQLGYLDDGHGAPTGDSVVGALGIPGVGTFDFATITPAVPPLDGNIVVGGQQVTAGAWMFPDGDNYVTALKARQSFYFPPMAPPLQPRPQPLDFDNPIVAAHDQLVHFWQRRITTGRAEIVGF